MFYFRILLVAVAAVAVMLAVKDGRILARLDLTGSCSYVAAPAGQAGVWYACTPGRLEGAKDLSRHSCTRESTRGESHLWRCPEALATDLR